MMDLPGIAKNIPVVGAFRNLPVRWKILSPIIVLGIVGGAILFALTADTAVRIVTDTALERAHAMSAQVRVFRHRQILGIVSQVGLNDDGLILISEAHELLDVDDHASIELIGLQDNDKFNLEAMQTFVDGSAQEYWQMFKESDRFVLRYAAAELIPHQACADCHNDMGIGGRDDWQVGDVTGGLALELDLSQQNRAMWKLAWRNGLLTGLVFIAALLIVGATIERSVNRPIERLVTVADSIGEGDLTHRENSTAIDELGRIHGALDTALVSMGDTVSGIAAGSRQLLRSAEELSSVSVEIATSADRSSGATRDLSSAFTKVDGNVQIVAVSALQLRSSIREIAESAAEASRVARVAVEMAEATGATVDSLERSSTQIGGFTKLISGIAARTNLLALNATIEAARAGEAGKGFAVVANEVKQLASQTASATVEIEKAIASIRSDASEASNVISEVGSVIAKINELQNSIASAVGLQEAATEDIGRTLQGTASESSSITLSITAVDDSARLTAANVRVAHEATTQLRDLAKALDALVSRFKLL